MRRPGGVLDTLVTDEDDTGVRETDGRLYRNSEYVIEVVVGTGCSSTTGQLGNNRFEVTGDVVTIDKHLILGPYPDMDEAETYSQVVLPTIEPSV